MYTSRQSLSIRWLWTDGPRSMLFRSSPFTLFIKELTRTNSDPPSALILLGIPYFWILPKKNDKAVFAKLSDDTRKQEIRREKPSIVPWTTNPHLKITVNYLKEVRTIYSSLHETIKIHENIINHCVPAVIMTKLELFIWNILILISRQRQEHKISVS